jgi:hypothetical protein
VKLSEYLQVLAYDIAFWMSAYQNSSYPLDQLGDVTEDVTAKLRAAAIIALLAKGDSDGYYHNLMRSARCRVAYLQRCHAAGHAMDHHQASSRLGGFMDAVAAADFVTARQIVSLSPRDWLEGHEYEDDYCYAQIVHELIAAQPDAARLSALFARFEKYLDGQADARLALTKAIHERDQGGFDEGIEALIAQHTDEIEAEKKRNKIEEPAMIAERQVYVDGLALLRIAERLDFTLQGEYLYLPSMARVAMQRAFPRE